MRIVTINDKYLGSFIEYCKKHRLEVDDSFLYDEDLRSFTIDKDNPTYVAINEREEVVGAASIIIDDYNRRGRKGRFRIFHSEIKSPSCYRELMDRILTHMEGLDRIFIFIPTVNNELRECMEQLNFKVERYSCLLVKDDLSDYVDGIKLPKEYEIRPLAYGGDEEAYCEVRNVSFKTLKGSETPVTHAEIAKLLHSEDHIEGGEMLLYHGERPVGVVRGAKDDYEDEPIMNIGPLAIIPEYQGKGLGRILLRKALTFARDNGYDRAILCVNAENERAKELYLKEGFRQTEAVVCYVYELNI